MEEGKVIDPVELDLCDYQEVEPVHPLFLLREDNNSLIEVSPYEALVIKDASKIGTVESIPTPGPQQDVLAPSEIPTQTQESPFRTDVLNTGPGTDTNLQHMDHWSVFTENLRYKAPSKPPPQAMIFKLMDVWIFPQIELAEWIMQEMLAWLL